MRIEEPYKGAQHIFIYKSNRSKEPHFTISGAHIEDLDRDKIKGYLLSVDWTDRSSKGWITPCLRCDDFLKV